MRATLIHNPSAGDAGLAASALLPLAILPLGTANNIARALGVVGDAHEIVARWRSGSARPIDVGVVSAPWTEARFIEGTGGGLLADLIEAARSDRARTAAMTGAKGDRALSLLELLTREARPSRWEVELDGEDLSGEYLAVEAMNIRFAGPKVPLAPEADPSDGLLDVVLLSEAERPALLTYLGGRLRDAAAELPTLPVHRGRHLRLRSVDGLPLHVGDDILDPSDESADDKADGKSDARRQAYDILLKQAVVQVCA